ncbi:MAG TPA: C39 family peptidase [Chloroflexia bacterium]|nr:C39 family peptidase [Chloroflexia bacterium]
MYVHSGFKPIGRLTRAGLILLITGFLFLFSGLFQTTLAFASNQALPDKVVLANFPIYAQQHYLSCEYAATRMITAYWKQEISEWDFIKSIPLNQNPHLGYRGYIDGDFGGTWDYGIYAEPIARLLDSRGFKTKLLVGGAEALKEELASGRPVQVWAIVGMSWGSPFKTEYEGLTFSLAAGEHSMVIYGYDAEGVYVADPGFGTRDYYSWDTFLRSWSYFDNMALSVWPSGTSTGEEPGSIGVSAYFYREWLSAGGMKIFGLPLEEAKTSGSKIYQYFERARMEYDLNGPANQPVQLGLVGTELTQNRQEEIPFQPVSPVASDTTQFFPTTGHTLSNGFRDYWQQNGGLAIFGYPISEEFREGSKVVQYFERARLEYYAENPDDYKILPGRLGAEQLAGNKFFEGLAYLLPFTFRTANPLI